MVEAAKLPKSDSNYCLTFIAVDSTARINFVRWRFKLRSTLKLIYKSTVTHMDTALLSVHISTLNHISTLHLSII
jgi:hypothetical protein